MLPLSKYIDHTLLKPTASESDIQVLCNEAIQNNFFAVCVNGCYVDLCKMLLATSNIQIASVIGFPLGAAATISKVQEAKCATQDGADEIDMVLNIAWLKDKKYTLVKDEIAAVKNAIGNKILKVIIETCYLTNDEKQRATELIIEAKADFVKTSTGFGTNGATLEDVALIKSITQNSIQIKASGGIRDAETALKYIELGVTRIGTSNGVQIVNGQISTNQSY